MPGHFRTGTDERREQDNNWRTAEFRLAALEALGIAPVQVLTSLTDISTTSPAALNNSSLSVTPGNDSMLLILAALDVQTTTWTTTASALIVECLVNGSAQAAQAIRISTAANDRNTLVGLWAAAVPGHVAATVSLQGKLNATGNVYRVQATHSKLIVLTVPTIT